MSLYSLFFVFVGSGLGGVCRWLLSVWLNGQHPLGTLVVNVIGCFLIGLLSRLLPADPHFKLLLITGFCGGFTTFSTLMNENFLMLGRGQIISSLFYMALSLVLGLFAVWLGASLK